MEREARSLALEEAYVHDVYHQMGCHESKAPWPRVVQFLNHLEPGSIVCDVGCGSGKYLSVNPSVFKLGVDRCNRLAESARLEQNEVLVCDNLTLPFRDESFDAVLSIAVVHHFATTERRVGALKELARVLRIGGRLLISVWAMEQRHRKFESQDVLVPWHRPQALSTPSLELTPTTTSEDDSHLHHTACTQTSDTDSNPSVKNCRERKKKEKQKEITTSASCSSLSSPNETCYSFVRRALQKLAGNKRNANTRHRPWFLDTWASCSSKDPPPRRYDPEGCEDIHDLPIELRRLEDEHDFPSRRQTFSCRGYSGEQHVNQKSRSLTDIFNHEQKLIVRSQSSVPSLENVDLEIPVPKDGTETVISSKPRLLVKQKKSVCEEDIDSEERDQATDMKDLVKALPEFKITGYGISKKGNVFKQSSMNEELMSTERLREKEKLKQNIQKQASLNEELIFNRNNKTLDSLKDTIFSTSTAKRFQILKNGLTNKIKNSTTGIEKVAGTSIKNGFVRILQGWTSSDVNVQIPQQISNPSSTILPEVKSTVGKEPAERRHSKEDGSDSSKDSSLQSDTSVDSEDSFASVIFIPKAEQVDQHSTNTSPTLHSNPASPQPTSPKIKFPPPVSPKLKNSQHSLAMSSHPVSPKLKNPNQLLGSSSPSSPKIKFFPQPNTTRPYQNNFNTSPTRTTFKQNLNGQHATNGNNVSPTSKSNDIFSKPISLNALKSPTNSIGPEKLEISEESKNFSLPETVTNDAEDPEPTSPPTPDTKSLMKSSLLSTVAKIDFETLKAKALAEKHACQTKEHQKGSRAQFPLVRRSMTISGRSDSPPSRAVPRLLSLEIFNPETDDMDSDSSGVSSPDSIGSVISIKNEDEGHAVVSEQNKDEDENHRTSGVGAELSSLVLNVDSQNENPDVELKNDECNASCKFSPLLEAAAGVANCLEETVDTVIQSSPRSRKKNLQLMCDPWMALQDDVINVTSPKNEIFQIVADNNTKLNLAPSPKRSKPSLKSIGKSENDSQSYLQEYNNSWDEECRQHLAEFAEKLSEKLLAEIDRYREQKTLAQQSSPELGECSSELYLSRLNEDLEDINKITVALQRDEESYLSKLFESNKLLFDQEELGRIKGEGASSEEKHVELQKEAPGFEPDIMDTGIIISHIKIEPEKNIEITEDSIPLLQEENDCFYSSSLDFKLHDDEPETSCNNIPLWESNFSLDTDLDKHHDYQIKQQKDCLESVIDKCQGQDNDSDTENNLADRVALESRRNKVVKAILGSQATLTETKPDIELEEDHLKLESGLQKEALRKPSISIEMTDLSQLEINEKEETTCHLSVGLSIESNEGADTSERTGSSSDGSRSGSRRETIQISDSGSILSLRPGLSVESSDAGEISEKGGSDGSRDSRRDTISLSDVTSCSQNSLLRPGTSMESSDPGDVSEKTGSDFSRQNTSSAGKTPSTTSFTSDRASDCSKDARFADRRMARCDGRSSSEETPLPKSCTNKLVRQGASAQEPSETLSKTQSSETSLSGSTSHDSLISDNGGGAITFHRYYHVFKEGELDQLIEKYVENLHIISSYYDHANWCIIAEKVQVWTI